MSICTSTASLDGVRRAIPQLRRLGYAALADQTAADRILSAALSDGREMHRLARLASISRSLELYRLYAQALERFDAAPSKVRAIRTHINPRTTHAVAARVWTLTLFERLVVALTRLDGFTTAQTVYVLQRPTAVVEEALTSALAALDPEGTTSDRAPALAGDFR